MTDSLIPLSQLSLELDVTAAQRADRYADQILLDDLNRRCLDRGTAATLIREHQTRQAGAAET